MGYGNTTIESSSHLSSADVGARVTGHLMPDRGLSMISVYTLHEPACTVARLVYPRRRSARPSPPSSALRRSKPIKSFRLCVPADISQVTSLEKCPRYIGRVVSKLDEWLGRG